MEVERPLSITAAERGLSAYISTRNSDKIMGILTEIVITSSFFNPIPVLRRIAKPETLSSVTEAGLTEEPCEGKLHAGICARGAGRPDFLPRRTLHLRSISRSKTFRKSVFVSDLRKEAPGSYSPDTWGNSQCLLLFYFLS